MKVVILAGGLGSRLSEETADRPKPMVEIAGRPVLWHIMKGYAGHGFTDFVLCLGYKGEIIKEYFHNYNIYRNDFTVRLGPERNTTFHGDDSIDDWSVTLADTGRTALKGARIKRIEKYVDEDVFMLTYGDGVANINIPELLAFHKKHNRLATVTGVRPPSRFGELAIREDGSALFREKPQASAGLINGGFFVLNREIFDHLVDDDGCDFENGPLEKLAEQSQLMVYEHSGDWSCMDTIRDVRYLNELYNKGQAFWKTW